MNEKDYRLYAKDCSELITDYLFFRDGMTVAEFEAEQKLFAEFVANGGKQKDYVSPFIEKKINKSSSVE